MTYVSLSFHLNCASNPSWVHGSIPSIHCSLYASVSFCALHIDAMVLAVLLQQQMLFAFAGKLPVLIALSTRIVIDYF